MKKSFRESIYFQTKKLCSSLNEISRPAGTVDKKTLEKKKTNSSLGSQWVSIKAEEEDDEILSGDEEEEDELPDEGEEVGSDIEKLDSRSDQSFSELFNILRVTVPITWHSPGLLPVLSEGTTYGDYIMIFLLTSNAVELE